MNMTSTKGVRALSGILIKGNGITFSSDCEIYYDSTSNALVIQNPTGTFNILTENTGILKTGDEMNGDLLFADEGIGIFFNDGSGIYRHIDGSLVIKKNIYDDDIMIEDNDGSNQQKIMDTSDGDTRYLRLTGGTMIGEIICQNDGQGITFMAGGRIFKKAGAGLVIKQPSNNIQLKLENYDGTNVRDVIDTVNGDVRYMKMSGHVTKDGDIILSSGNFKVLTGDRGLHFPNSATLLYSTTNGIIFNLGTGNIQPKFQNVDGTNRRDIVDTVSGDVRYLRVTNPVITTNSAITITTDNLGIKLFDGGMFYKRSGGTGGMTIRQTGSIQPKIENNDGTNQRDIVDTANGATLYLAKNNAISTTNITVSTDNMGVLFNDGAQIYKRSGGGLTLKQNTTNRQPIIENWDQSNRRDIVDTINGATLYAPKSSELRLFAVTNASSTPIITPTGVFTIFKQGVGWYSLSLASGFTRLECPMVTPANLTNNPPVNPCVANINYSPTTQFTSFMVFMYDIFGNRAVGSSATRVDSDFVVHVKVS